MLSVTTTASRRLRFGPPPTEKKTNPKPKREKVKADPKHVAAARELRDRYLEQFNSGMVLSGGKYEVCRQIDAKGSRAVGGAQAVVEAKMLAA